MSARPGARLEVPVWRSERAGSLRSEQAAGFAVMTGARRQIAGSAREDTQGVNVSLRGHFERWLWLGRTVTARDMCSSAYVCYSSPTR